MEKRKIVLKNGEVYHYLEQGQGDRVLILIHGNLSSSLYFTPLFKRLPKDIRVIAPDLRGYGDSSYYQQINRLRDFADDIHLFLEAKEIKKVDLLGWSLGGGVALEFAAHYPEKTNKLILMNSTTHRGYPIFKKDQLGQPIVGEVYPSRKELALDPVQVLPVLKAQEEKNFAFLSYIFELTIYTVNKPSVEDNRIWINESLKQRNLVDADWALANLNMSDQHNLYQPGDSSISKIEAPVLHLWGSKDVTVPAYMMQDNINALPKISASIVYENCGHSPLVDEPDKLTQDILNFIL